MIIKENEKETPLRFTNTNLSQNSVLRTHFYIKLNQNLNTFESELKLNLLLIYHQFYILPPHKQLKIKRAIEKRNKAYGIC